MTNENTVKEPETLALQSPDYPGRGLYIVHRDGQDVVIARDEEGKEVVGSCILLSLVLAVSQMGNVGALPKVFSAVDWKEKAEEHTRLRSSLGLQ